MQCNCARSRQYNVAGLEGGEGGLELRERTCIGQSALSSVAQLACPVCLPTLAMVFFLASAN